MDLNVFGDTLGSVVSDANADVALVHTGKAAAADGVVDRPEVTSLLVRPAP